MKKYFVLLIIVIACFASFGISQKANATGTTFTLVIGGYNASGATYTWEYRLIDYPSGTYSTGWTTSLWAISYGTNYTVPFPIDVPYDSTPRWIMMVRVTRHWGGVDSTEPGNSGLLTTEQYYSGNVNIEVDFRQ